ncbi:olfactory receptor 5B3-like, partial [Cavia porcellus]|uniref:olfactory receptor 5B3-like n=1 Tax=Cavia porcellus TaxID=10141 RepID=UPI002FE22499
MPMASPCHRAFAPVASSVAVPTVTDSVWPCRDVLPDTFISLPCPLSSPKLSLMVVTPEALLTTPCLLFTFPSHNVNPTRLPLFITLRLIYTVTLAGNLGMTLLIFLDSHLHSPMYLFLGHLWLVDFCSPSIVTPTVIAGILLAGKVISYNAYAAQMFLFVAFIDVENYQLTSMAYGHYATMSKPLHYTTTMTTSLCTGLVLGCYACGFLNAALHIENMFSISFCNVVQHFFCDIPALMVLSCSEKQVSELVLVYIVSFHIFFAFFLTLTFIFITILSKHSSTGAQKALSTCESHFTAVSIFYATSIFMYLQPSSSHFMDMDKIASVLYIIVIPMLNPVVYS